MALGPISTNSIPTPQPAPARDVSAAQRAFFQAALNRVQAAPEAAPAAAPAAAPTVEPAKASEPSAPANAYRPGKLLDIKV
jgi:hypothetical protein